MESEIAKAIGLKHEPVAIMLANEKPEGAKQFKEGKISCIMHMLAAAIGGKQVVFDRDTLGCPGGATGMGFGNAYEKLFNNLPGGMECYYYMMSVGNENWEQGRNTAQLIKPFLPKDFFERFVYGERYCKTPELMKAYLECLPMTDVPFEYVVFKPLREVDLEKEKPEVVIFLVNMDQMSALVSLSHSSRGDIESVIIPNAAGCHSSGIFPFREAKSEKPRAVVGLIDRHSREQLKQHLKEDLMTFTTPFDMFQEMEANIPGMFLESRA